MSPWTLANLAAWSAQAAMLIAAGLLGARLGAWNHPASRLRFYQALLAASLLLPLLGRPGPVPAPEPAGVVLADVSVESGPMEPQGFGWTAAIPWILTAGAAARLGRLLAGLARLRGLRRQGRVIPYVIPNDAPRGVEVREVDGLRGPIAFGWPRAVILLPADLAAGPVRDAALRHELEHIARRDWIENLAEQAAGALFWFHPAVQWLLERIHLAREQAVDAAVAGSGPGRDRYLQSLVAAAGLANPPSLPAASFVRRPRHLVARVAYLSKEAPMSIVRIAAAAALSSVLTCATVAVATLWFPIQLAAQDAGPASLHWDRPAANTEGTVMVEATVSESGEVLDARVVGGPDELRRRALESVLYWRAPGGSGRRTLTITIDFKKQARQSNAPAPPPPPPAPPIDQAAVEGVDYIGMSTATR